MNKEQIQLKNTIFLVHYIIMIYSIRYGTLENNIDVTQIALDKCIQNGILCIPLGDCERAALFTDPVPNVVKDIFISETYSDTEPVSIPQITIKYGTSENNVDVTQIALEKCMKDGVLHIPSGDEERAALFTDPVPNVVKQITITRTCRHNESISKNIDYTQTLEYGRFANQVIRNLAVSLIAQKHNLLVKYCNYTKFNELGIHLFCGSKTFNTTKLLTGCNLVFTGDNPDYNYFEILNANVLNHNLNPNPHYFQTKDICNLIYKHLHNDHKVNIINANQFKDRYENNNDCFIHVRLTDAANFNLGFSYYDKVLSTIAYSQLYLATDEDNHEIIKQIMDKYPSAKILSYNEVDTIKFGSTCKNIILSHGSFSAFVGYIAFYSSIYYAKYKYNWHGDMFSIPGWNMID